MTGPLRSLATFPTLFSMRSKGCAFPPTIFPGSSSPGNLQGQNRNSPGMSESSRISSLCAAHGWRWKTEGLSRSGFRIRFLGNLKAGQKRAVAELKEHETGVLVAPAGSGKTVMACAMIGQWKVPTLILVNRRTLLEQWIDRIASFLTIERKEIGLWQGIRQRLNGKVDIAMIQSIAHSDEPKRIFRDYGAVIIDECHHVPAATVEGLMKGVFISLHTWPHRHSQKKGPSRETPLLSVRSHSSFLQRCTGFSLCEIRVYPNDRISAAR